MFVATMDCTSGLSEYCREIFVPVRKLSSKNAKFGLETPIFWKIRGEIIEILRYHNFHCWKFSAVCQKIATCCSVYFIEPRTSLDRTAAPQLLRV